MRRAAWQLILVVVSVTIHAYATEPCGSLQRVANASRLAMILYPDLREQELSISFSDGVGGSTLGATDARMLSMKFSGRSEAANEGPLQSSTHFGETPTILAFSFIDSDSGRIHLHCWPLSFENRTDVNGRKEVLDLINAHPEWTDRNAIELASKYGLRFGPEKKAAVLQLIPLKELSRLYGPLRIKNADFSVASDKCNGCSFAELRWYIHAEEIGTPRRLQIVVEPFEGKVVGLDEEQPNLWPICSNDPKNPVCR